MTERIERMRQFFVVDKGQKAMWQKEENPYVLAEQFAAEQTPDVDRACWIRKSRSYLRMSGLHLPGR